jgi:hypothetical protein
MARIKFGAIVTDAAGKIGGHTFGNSLSGNTLYTKRTKGKGQLSGGRMLTSGNSVRSLAGAQALIGLAQSWRNLTDAQRLAWSGASPNFKFTSRFNGAKTYSGYHLYMKLNTQIKLIDGTILTNPPAVTTLPVAGQVSVAASVAGDITVGWANALGANYGLIIEAAACTSKGLGAQGANYKRMDVNQSGTDTDEIITAPYQAVFGRLILGTRLNVRVRVLSLLDGTTSPYVIATCIVAA